MVQSQWSAKFHQAELLFSCTESNHLQTSYLYKEIVQDPRSRLPPVLEATRVK